MPSASTVFDRTFTNLGSIADSWTPAPSCASATDQAAFVEASMSGIITVVADCKATNLDDNCYPSASALNSARSSARNNNEPAPTAYFSPAVACPEGWETVGRVNGGNNPKPTGVFTTTWDNEDLNVPVAHEFQQLLDADETMKWCCPKGWDVYYDQGICQSTIGNAKREGYSTGCVEILPTDGVTIVNEYEGSTLEHSVASFGTFTGALTTSTITIDEEMESATAVQFLPVVAAIYRSEDVDGPTDTGAAGGGSHDDDDGDDGDDDDDDAAAGLRVSVLFTVAVVGAAMLFGAGQVVPW